MGDATSSDVGTSYTYRVSIEVKVENKPTNLL